MHALRSVIAARAGRDRAVAPVVLLLWPYLHRLATRFQALVRQLQAGGPVTRLRPDPIQPVQPPAPRPTARSPRLPQGFAWLIRLVPETAQLAGQVRHLLADPEFSALLATAPQAGRILRPLCQMLGIRPDPDLPPALFQPPPVRAALPHQQEGRSQFFAPPPSAVGVAEVGLTHVRRENAWTICPRRMLAQRRC